MIEWDKFGILLLILIVVAVAYWRLSKFFMSREKPVAISDGDDNMSDEIVERLKTLQVPVVPISVWMEKYPYAFALFADKYPDPLEWDKLFASHRFNIAASLKIFFAEHGYTYTKKETLNYDKRHEAIRVVEYKVLITKKLDDGNQVVKYKGSGNPFEIMSHSVEWLFDALNTECVNGRVEFKEYHVPLSEKECTTCLALKRNNPNRLEICPDCGNILTSHR